MNRKVRTGSTYVFHPTFLDKHASHLIGVVKQGDEVRVMQPYGCPKNGTMGHCYIETMSGQFVGLVCTNSLYSRKEYPKLLKESEHV